MCSLWRVVHHNADEKDLKSSPTGTARSWKSWSSRRRWQRFVEIGEIHPDSWIEYELLFWVWRPIGQKIASGSFGESYSTLIPRTDNRFLQNRGIVMLKPFTTASYTMRKIHLYIHCDIGFWTVILTGWAHSCIIHAYKIWGPIQILNTARYLKALKSPTNTRITLSPWEWVMKSVNGIG